LKLDAFAQSVLRSAPDDATEVLVADDGRWEVSATEDPACGSDSESEDMKAIRSAVPLSRSELQQAALNLGRVFSTFETHIEKSMRCHREVVRSRSPKRQAEARIHTEQSVEAPCVMDKIGAWEKLQGIERKKVEKVETRIGCLPEGTRCTRCEKAVVDRGGVYCGRRRPNNTCSGCFAALCWKCMNKSGRDDIGGIRTSKTEFLSLGPDAWWMHEKCMLEEDKRAYFGDAEEDDVGKPRDLDSDDDDHPGKFAWE